MQMTELIESEDATIYKTENLKHHKDKPLILVVEDDTELRNFIAASLNENYNVAVAENGVVACNYLESNNVHMIVSDVNMPQMNGYELTKYVKNNINYCHIPIALLTAKGSIDDKVKGVDFGADFYISKPFSIEFLKKTFGNFFKHQQLLIEKFKGKHAVETAMVANNIKDKEFLSLVDETIERLMISNDFKLDDLYKEVGISRTPFTNKIRALTGLSPNELVRTIRLRKAAQLLTETNLVVNEVCFKIGITNLSYFSKIFKQEFGCSPSEFVQKNKSLDYNSN